MVETGLIIASSIILVILAVPTLQGVVLLNRVPDANDTESLEKLGLDRSQIDGAITVNVTGKRFFWIFEYPNLVSSQPMNLFFRPPKQCVLIYALKM